MQRIPRGRKQGEFSHTEDLPRLSHYLRYIIRKDRGIDAPGFMERFFPRYRANIRKSISFLTKQLDLKKLSKSDFVKLDLALLALEGASDKALIAKNAKIVNEVLNKIKKRNIEFALDEIVKADKINQVIGSKRTDLSVLLRTKRDTLEAVYRNVFIIPPIGFFVDMYRDITNIGHEWYQWRAMQYDPLLRSQGKIRKTGIKVGALSSFVSLAAAALLVSLFYGASLPTILILAAPFIITAAAGIDLTSSLISLGANLRDLYREFKAKEPFATYRLRMLRRTTGVMQNLSDIALRAMIFVVALGTIVAFTNPVGLAVLAASAIGAGLFSLSTYLFTRFYLNKKIQQAEASLKSQAGESGMREPGLGNRNEIRNAHDLRNAQDLRNASVLRDAQRLNAQKFRSGQDLKTTLDQPRVYSHQGLKNPSSRNPSSRNKAYGFDQAGYDQTYGRNNYTQNRTVVPCKLKTRENAPSLERAMHNVHFSAHENEQTFLCARYKTRSHANQFVIFDNGSDPKSKNVKKPQKIAEVAVFKKGLDYTLSGNLTDSQIKTLFKSIQKGEASEIVLSGQNLNEVLKIYRLGVKEKMLNMEISKNTKYLFEHQLTMDDPLRKVWEVETEKMAKLKADVSLHPKPKLRGS